MKTSSFFKPFVVTAASLLFAGACLAQTPGMSGMEAVMTKLFGENKSFTATVEMSITDTNGNQIMSMPTVMLQLDGKMRSEIDMEKMKGSAFPPGAVDQMKAMGMNRTITIMRPDTKTMTMIYPGLTSYVQMPIPKEQADALNSEPKMEKVELGKETVDGHACVKNKITITDVNGKKQDITVWNATDMKNFPLKMQITNPTGGDIVILYKNIKFEKPDAKLFEPPADYTKYASQMELMQKVMQKQMGGAKP
jgi:hypothetical protein